MHFTRSSSIATSIAAALVCFTMAATPAAAQTFGTSSSDFGIGPLGNDASGFGAIAQTFISPVGAPVVTSFSFFLGNYNDGAHLIFEASIYAFTIDGTTNGHITGGSLYSRSVAGDTHDDGNFYAFVPPISGLSISLMGGTRYAFVLRNAAGSAVNASNFVGTTAGETFSLGQLYTATGSTISQLSAGNAFTLSNSDTFGTDASIVATFRSSSTVPEPSTVALLASGLVAVVIAARRRRTTG